MTRQYKPRDLRKVLTSLHDKNGVMTIVRGNRAIKYRAETQFNGERLIGHSYDTPEEARIERLKHLAYFEDKYKDLL